MEIFEYGDDKQFAWPSKDRQLYYRAIYIFRIQIPYISTCCLAKQESIAERDYELSEKQIQLQ